MFYLELGCMGIQYARAMGLRVIAVVAPGDQVMHLNRSLFL